MTKEIGENKETEPKKEVKKISGKESPVIKASDVAKVMTQEEPLEKKRIYVGPGKPGLITNTVYDGDFPIYVKQMIEECPAIGKLMVKISDYAKAKENVGKTGTVEIGNAQRVLDYFKDKGGNK